MRKGEEEEDVEDKIEKNRGWRRRNIKEGKEKGNKHKTKREREMKKR